MSITVRDTKLLWGRAAGRCSLCRVELTADTKHAAVPLGEQAHIVAEETGGPRGDSPLTGEQRNTYDNLILLCPNCHTRADKDPHKYTVVRLRGAKKEHEDWVRQTGLAKHPRLGTAARVGWPLRYWIRCTAIVGLPLGGAMVGQAIVGIGLALLVLAVEYFGRERVLPIFGPSPAVRFWTLVALAAASIIYLSTGLGPESIDIPLAAAMAGPFQAQFAVHLGACAAILALGRLTDGYLQYQLLAASQTNPLVTASGAERVGYSQCLERYSRALVAELDRYDREVNWSDQELTPLEAEVEQESSGLSGPRVVRDLVEAVRSDRAASVFVVLGDPGSGKSVSLRRLVRIAAAQSASTGIVPVYVNLREYPTNEEPTPESILAFIRDSTSRQTGRDGREFLDTWYERFRTCGRLFFVFDSFDELPAVLDCDERSDSHRRITKAFDRFCTQEVQSCRVVLASRIFRSPVQMSGARLLIRPFTEAQIRAALHVWLKGRGIDPVAFVHGLFTQRPHMAALLRNPFTAQLIAEHARASGSSVAPETMFNVFEDYVHRRLETEAATLRSFQLVPVEVRKGAGYVAEAMYMNSQAFGLEAEVDELEPHLPGRVVSNLNGLVEALKSVRLARLGGGSHRRFSFVHRRFAEFFVVDRLREVGWRMNLLETIPTDSRWRECLVLGCSILDAARRAEVARYCWTVIAETKFQLDAKHLPHVRKAVHCARFLADAFRGDSQALEPFGTALGRYTIELLGHDDLLVVKIGAELIPLLPPYWQQLAIWHALQLRSPWISETTLSGCRHLGALDASSHKALRAYLGGMPLLELATRFTELDFSLSLSDAFAAQRHLLRLDMAEFAYRMTVAASFGAIGLFYAPILWLPVLGVGLIELPRLRGNIVRPFRDEDGTLYSKYYYARSDYPPNFLIKPTGAELLGMMPVRDLVDAALHIVTIAFTGMFAAVFVLVLADQEYPGSHLMARLVDFLLARIWITPALVVAGILATVRWDRFYKLAELSVRKRLIRTIVPEPPSGAKKAFSEEQRWSVLSWLRGQLSFAAKTSKTLIVGGYLAVVLIVLVAANLRSNVKLVERWATSLAGRMRDRRRLATAGLPENISCPELFSQIAEFSQEKSAVKYLYALRIRRVRLVGEITEPPAEWERRAELSEEFARLREQWLDLER